MDTTVTNGPSRSSTSLVVTTVFLVISSVFVALRFISRIGVVKRFELDDWFMVAAWVRSPSGLVSCTPTLVC